MDGSSFPPGLFRDSILIVMMLPRVSSWSKQDLKGVKFFFIIEKTLSSPAFECGMVRTSRAIVESRGKCLWPSGVVISCRWPQTTSCLSRLLASEALANSLTEFGRSSSSIVTKSWTSFRISRWCERQKVWESIKETSHWETFDNCFTETAVGAVPLVQSKVHTAYKLKMKGRKFPMKTIFVYLNTLALVNFNWNTFSSSWK